MESTGRKWVVMVRFTREEFDIMVHELLYSQQVSFDMLCKIAEKTLKPTVCYWCSTEPCLQGRGYEEDVMQEVYLRLMKTVVPSFLLRHDITGPFNDDPEGFEDWMFKVAQNIKRDVAARVRNVDFNTDELDDSLCAPNETPEEARERKERLQEAFSIVLSADVGVYKVLTWIAQFVFILEHGVTKIESNDLIIQAFEDRTLYEMYDMILRASAKITWMEITDEQDQKILVALRKMHPSGVAYGEIKYRDFFMKQNGEPAGKKSISDWVNRMNGLIRRKGETSGQDQKENTAGRQHKKERRGGNGASDD